jgi:hypothetical protein
MTILTPALKKQILTLREGKVGPAKIARKWNIDSNTSQRSKLVAGLPPKDNLPKHNYSGRNGGLVSRYLEDYPMARLDDIIAAFDLTCGKSTLCKYKKGAAENPCKEKHILLKDVHRA